MSEKLTPEEKKMFQKYLDERVNKVLIVHDDNIHTFEYVIICLMKTCKHTEVQAEQCSRLIHNNGECDVKIGSENLLLSMKEKLETNELTVSIRDYEPVQY